MVHSPTIDALARDGLLLGRHYAYLVCCPTRSSFTSGRLPIHVNVNNANGVEELNGVDLRMTTLAEKLKQAGYKTHAAGKWRESLFLSLSLLTFLPLVLLTSISLTFSDAGAHLHGQLPLQRGFDSFVGFLRGWENHFTQQQVFPPNTGGNGGQGPTPFKNATPVDFWLDDGPAYGKNGQHLS